MKNNEDIYVINPAYFLRKEDKFILFCTRDNLRDNNGVSYNADFFSNIHPLNAKLLSFFNGARTVEEVLVDASNYFKLSVKDLEEIIINLLENEKGLSIAFGKEYMGFPKNTLVKKEKVTHFFSYNLNDFTLTNNVKFGIQRLSNPLTINLLLTMKCFTDCIYCYANRKISNKAMALDLIKSIIHQARNLNVLTLDVNGGEVLYHPDHLEIFEELIKNGYSPLLSTKIPISKNDIYNLKNIGLNHLQISLDSVNPFTLQKILKVNHSYWDKMQQTLKDLQELKMNVTLHSVISSLNSSIEEIHNMIEFAQQFNNIKELRLTPAGYSLYKESYESYKAPRENLELISAYIDEYMQNKDNQFEVIFDSFSQKENYEMSVRKKQFSKRAICTGNLRGCVILPDGRVTICEELYDHPAFIIGDLTKESLDEVWNSERANELFYIQKEQIQKNSPCHSCTDLKKCRHMKGVCWKEILMAYGKENWDYPDVRCPKAPVMYNKIYVE